jgi:hypothetical protein
MHHRFLQSALLAAALLVPLLAPSARSSAQTSADRPPDQVALQPRQAPGVAAASGYTSPPTEAAHPFTHLLLRREAGVPVGAELALFVRASVDGAAWSDWSAAGENHDLWLESDGPDVEWSATIAVGALARFWQVRVEYTPAPDGALPELRRIDVNTVDASGPAAPAAPPIGTLAALAKPPVVSRTAWGNPDGQGSRAAPAYYPVNHLVVHHTADSNSLLPGEPDWAARVRAEWRFHTYTRGWGDVGYNYLIDPNGVIYEGRAGGDDAVAFHDTANYGSMGVVLIGTYSNVRPTGAAQDALVGLLAWKAGQKQIDPLGSSYYYGCDISKYCRPFNAGAVVPNIAGHRQVTPGHTTCPGDEGMAILPGVRERVRQLLGGGGGGGGGAAEISRVEYDRTTLASGELLKVTFTVRNTGDVALHGQSPRVDLSAGGGLNDLNNGYVYDQDECFGGNVSGSYPAYPKEDGRFRVVLGTPGWDARDNGCVDLTSDYPWRWGLNGDLAPGQEQTIVGYVRFRVPGTYALQAGLVQEYVRYHQQGVGAASVTVTPERIAPADASYDELLRPLARVYRLGAIPDNFLARTRNPLSIPRGEYVGSFAWDGSFVDWWDSGPFGMADQYLVEQTRSFLASSSGEYIFRTTSDDGSWLWVDGQPVVVNNGLHSVGDSTGTLWLGAGVHVVSFKYFERTGYAAAGYDFQPPGEGAFRALPDGLGGGAPSFGGTFVEYPSLALTADDQGGVGVSYIRWSWDGVNWQDSPGGVLALGRLANSGYRLRYQSVDGAGNAGETRELAFVVNTNLPLTRRYLPLGAR